MSAEKPVLPDNKRRRNLALLFALLAFVVIVFGVTIVKMAVHHA